LPDYLSLTIEVCSLTFDAWTRYLAASAEAIAQLQMAIAHSTANEPFAGNPSLPAENRVLLDETRAFLRRIGDAGTKEARRVEHGLQQIGESLAQGAASAVQHPRPDRSIRRHEVKP
jgi:hypothetical protein